MRFLTLLTYFPYSTLHRTRYLLFGTLVSAGIEAGGVARSIALVFLIRGRRPAVVLTGSGQPVLTAQIVWWAWDPVNAGLVSMAIQDPAPDWVGWHYRQEFAHLVRFGLLGAGLVALLASVLGGTA